MMTLEQVLVQNNYVWVLGRELAVSPKGETKISVHYITNRMYIGGKLTN